MIDLTRLNCIARQVDAVSRARRVAAEIATGRRVPLQPGDPRHALAEAALKRREAVPPPPSPARLASVMLDAPRIPERSLIPTIYPRSFTGPDPRLGAIIDL